MLIIGTNLYNKPNPISDALKGVYKMVGENPGAAWGLETLDENINIFVDRRLVIHVEYSFVEWDEGTWALQYWGPEFLIKFELMLRARSRDIIMKGRE